MNLNERFWKNSKKRNLNHSSWTCVLALLQRRGWRRPTTPRVHIYTTSLITRSCWTSGSATCCPSPCPRPRLELEREFYFHFYCYEVSHSFTPGSDCKTLVLLFFQTCCAPSLKTPARRLLDARSRDELAPPKMLEKKEEVPRWHQCRTHWARQVGALSAWFYSLAWIFLSTSSPECSLRGSDRDPAHQTEACEYELCVNPALRLRNKVKFRSNIVFFASFFLKIEKHTISNRWALLSDLNEREQCPTVWDCVFRSLILFLSPKQSFQFFFLFLFFLIYSF